MKKITNISSFSSTISSEFLNINFIEIEDKPFGEGGFGIVYHCKSINGKQTKIPQVIKIFIDHNGSAARGLDTIKKLQEKIKGKVLELQQKGKLFLDIYPAMQGCPQFSFEGTLGNEKVIGYAANNLKFLGYDELGELMSESNLRKKFFSIPLINRFKIAYEIVQTFELLEQFRYIHADFKEDAVFIDIKNYSSAIIDYESGSVIQNINDKPTTWGTPQDWLAPEITKQYADGLKKRKKASDPIPVKVDLKSDRWSVAVCIHYLIFMLPPYYFFTENSERCLKELAKSNIAFPNFDKNYKYFDKSKTSILNNFYKKYYNTKLPKDLQTKISDFFSKGAHDFSKRITYAQWKYSLNVKQVVPKIIAFKANKKVVTDKNGVTLFWKVEEATSITLNNIDVTNLKKYTLQIKRETEIELIAKNAFSSVSKKIKIQVSAKPPVILNFKTNLPSNYLTQKQSFQLYWTVSNATNIEMDNGIGDVTNKNQLLIAPVTKDTKYILKATSFFGIIVSKQITVTVSKTPPKIITFASNKLEVKHKKDHATLSWKINNAEKISIDQGIGDVSIKNNIGVLPKSDTKYTITAYSFFGMISKASLIISVSKLPPKIVSFTSNKLIVKHKKDHATLSWKINNAEKITIDQGVGDVSIKNNVDVLPKNDTKYTITACSFFGIISKTSVVISVSKLPPKILDLKIIPSIRLDENPLQMYWNTENAESLKVLNTNELLNNSGSREIKPIRDTQYILEATSYFGVTSQKIITALVSKKPPIIKTFKFSKAFVKVNTDVDVFWDVINAHKIWINGNKIDVNSGRMNILVKENQQFKIIAESYFGVRISNQASIRILKKPVLKEYNRAIKHIKNKL